MGPDVTSTQIQNGIKDGTIVLDEGKNFCEFPKFGVESDRLGGANTTNPSKNYIDYDKNIPKSNIKVVGGIGIKTPDLSLRL